MGQSIAVMNTKGGVGKSTVVMALAETLSAYHGKNVLVIDSDSQTSMSTMLMHVSSWERMEQDQHTLVDYLMEQVLGEAKSDWRDFIATGVSDVEEASSVYLIPSHMELSLFERDVSAKAKEDRLSATVRKLLAETTRMFDYVLIDCPPGLSLLTEIWLREVQYFIPPTKPDYLAIRGLDILKRFRKDYANNNFAELLGVLINLKDGRIASEEEWHKRLMDDPANRCFAAYIPRRAYIQRAADFDQGKRTYIAKYPGDAGLAIRSVTQEVMDRMAGKPAEAGAPLTVGLSPPVRNQAAPVVAAAAPAPAPTPASTAATIPVQPAVPPRSPAYTPAPAARPVAAASPPPAVPVPPAAAIPPRPPIPPAPASTGTASGAPVANPSFAGPPPSMVRLAADTSGAMPQLRVAAPLRPGQVPMPPARPMPLPSSPAGDPQAPPPPATGTSRS